MEMTIKILVVEDNPDMLESYEDSAEEISDKYQEYSIVIEPCTTVEEAMSALKEGDYDGAIIDLNLNASSPHEAGGNILIKEILGKIRFPVRVISGNLDNLDADITGNESSFLKFQSRSEVDNNSVFEDFISLYKTGITKLLGRRGDLEAKLSDVFWKHLSKDISDWARENISEQVLLRYTLNHLNEYLDRSLESYDEREFYIKPPIKDFIATGDIVENGLNRYLVVSPACDITPRGIEENIPKINAKKILLCPLLPISRNTFVSNRLIPGDMTSRDKLKKALEKIIKGQDPKFHFLPQHGSLQASICDFQNVETCDINEFLVFARAATVSGDFMRDIQSRFTAYIGRQGQPDLDKDAVANKHVESLLT